LWEFIDSDPELTLFADVVRDADLTGLFEDGDRAAEVLAAVLPEPLPQPVIDVVNTQGVTALVPTNMAMQAALNSNDLATDETALQHFVLAHVLPGQLDEEAIFAATQVTALSGDVLLIDAGTTQTINGAHLVVIGQLGTNGIAHTVDAVLVVPQVTPSTTEESTSNAAAPPTTAPPVDSAPVPTPPPATGA
jgi:Fasciclin domain